MGIMKFNNVLAKIFFNKKCDLLEKQINKKISEKSWNVTKG